jgi:transmembrane sensor
MEYAAVIAFIEQFATGQYTEAEHREFIAWLYSAPPAEVERVMDAAMARGLAPLSAEKEADGVLVGRIEAALDEFEQESGQERPGAARIRRFTRFSVAAAVIVLLAGAGWWLTRRPSTPASAIVATAAKSDVAPGRNAAVLTLSGGQQIILDSAAQDTVLTEGAAIVANSQGHLAYNSGNAAPVDVVYNTLTTARGNQYQLALPDGTKVWLNASSSIRYPTAFGGSDREVTITGEAYFEVAKDAVRPFHVRATDLDIAVLGTSFNINTYPDEPVSKTTLVEGSVRVSDSGRSQSLRPGQQVQVRGNQLSLIPNADMEQALAWKNGLVKLTGASIQEVMRQVSRWYDVDVQYEGNLDKAVFVGVVSRQQSLSALLQVLEATGSVHCTLNQNTKTIIVKP